MIVAIMKNDTPEFSPGDRVFVLPNKMFGTVIKQQKVFDTEDYWFWGEY